MGIKHIIDFNDMPLEMWYDIYETADDILKNPEKYANKCAGKILATLFYEPSTRTMLSFQTAMLRLGGSVIGFDNPGNSSVSKGENLKDTIRIISNYADIAVMRNPNEGAAYAASLYSQIPVINAGDGGHLHPTQTMTDLFTITKEKGRLENLSFGLCGDLMNGRTVHSLLKAMSLFKNNKFYLISTFQLRTPKYITDILKASGNEFYEVNTLDECIDKLDILYMTRIQKERFASEELYNRQKGVYVLDSEKMKKAKPDLAILHPLPKIDEITDEVDYDKRALYFTQARYGMYVRMALILKMLENGRYAPDLVKGDKSLKCPNPRCITTSEPYLPGIFYDVNGTRKTKACKYCDYRAE